MSVTQEPFDKQKDVSEEGPKSPLENGVSKAAAVLWRESDQLWRL